MIRPTALLAVVIALGAAAPVSADIGPFRGVGTATLDRFHHLESTNFFSNSKDIYTARFVYSYRVDEHGSVRGRGQGVYNSATWHLEGHNGDNGDFSCDVPMRTSPNYVVDIFGHVEDGDAKLTFALDGAEEINDDYDCGADYKGLATRSTYLANSLRTVQGDDGLSVDLARPRIGPLRLLEETGDQSDRRVILHEWDISVRPPERPPDVGPDAPPGFQSAPSPGGTSICTIEGTRRGDRLAGTRGNDIICGYGGRDRINGRGGHDLVLAGPGDDRIKGGGGLDALYGNFGDDRLSTRDRKRDKAHGGSGSDSATVDRRDRTVSVERVRRR